MPIEPAVLPRRPLGSLAGEPAQGLAPGAVVSLNLSRRKLLATSSGFKLDYKNPTGSIPVTSKPDEIIQLRKLLERGEIILGPNPILSLRRPGLLEPLYEEVDKAQTVDDIRVTVVRIVNRQKHLAGMQPAEALRHMIAHESQGACRPEIMNFLGGIMDRTGGHSGVTEDVQDARVVRLPRRADGTIAVPDNGPVGESPEAHKEAVRSLI